MHAWQLRPGALVYRALVRLRGAQDNQLEVLGRAPLYEQSRELDPLLTAALRPLAPHADRVDRQYGFDLRKQKWS